MALPAQHWRDHTATVISTVARIRQYIAFLQEGLTGIAAEDGRVLWQYSNTVGRAGNTYTPIVRDDLVFSANGYGVGMALFKLVAEGDRVSVVEQYHEKFNFNPFQDSTAWLGIISMLFRVRGRPCVLNCEPVNWRGDRSERKPIVVPPSPVLIIICM